MISAFDRVQRCARPESIDDGEQKIGSGEGVPRPLQKEHRKVYTVEVIGALDPRLARRMEGKAEKDEAPNSRQG